MNHPGLARSSTSSSSMIPRPPSPTGTRARTGRISGGSTTRNRFEQGYAGRPRSPLFLAVDAQHGSDRMVQVKALSGRQLIRPKALLLDFGGVIVQTTPIPGWEMKLALHV